MDGISVIYRVDAWSGKQYPELHELEIGLGFRGRKGKKRKYRYPVYIGLNSTAVRKRWILMRINTQPQAASLGSDGSGQGSGTEL